MHRFSSLVLIVSATLICAQEYGQVSTRPTQYTGIEPSRANFRQRFTSPRVPETVQSVDQPQIIRSRRPQNLRKSNLLLQQHQQQQHQQQLHQLQQHQHQQQILEQAKGNVIDDVPVQYGPTPGPQFQQLTTRGQTPKPVQESSDEESGETTLDPTPSTPAFTPSLRTSFSPSPAPGPLHQPQEEFQKTQYLQPRAFRPSPFQGTPIAPGLVPEAILQERHSVRQQTRPIQQAALPVPRSPLRSFSPPKAAENSESEEDYFRQAQNRPLRKQEPARQQIIDREPAKDYPSRQTEVVRSEPRQQYLRPVQRVPHTKAPQRERKPVSQTIRKYHEEREDGTIVWGYENDDGSFKEEIIGIDCVTRGKYGYVDPDGVKREYTYQTGIPCVKAEENEAAASDLGYIDYTNNKYVLPNGDEIDLEAMVKNRARKPVQQFRIRP